MDNPINSSTTQAQHLAIGFQGHDKITLQFVFHKDHIVSRSRPDIVLSSSLVICKTTLLNIDTACVVCPYCSSPHFEVRCA